MELLNGTTIGSLIAMLEIGILVAYAIKDPKPTKPELKK